LYPIFAEYMPGILNGISRPFLLTAQFHILSTGSAMGLLLRIYADIILGFVIFGTAVISTGGGKFFLDMARAVVGRTRGGTAKVAVFASAIFGSLSGSSIANVITTGSFTIPTMKKSGYPPHYAGAVECCASTAGTFTPPVMGATAFVMASFLAVPYSTVVLVAAIPAFLFYFGLYVQIDGWAAKTQERKVVEIEIPSLLKTLKDGWIYLPAIGALVYYLFVLRLVGESPYVATALLLVLSQFRRDTRFTWQTFTEFIESSGRSLMELLVVMVGIGMLLGSFSITGLAVTFARELLNLAGGNIAFMLILAFVSSFIMGMGMTIVAVYIFLAIIVAPALIAAGLNELAVHLFVMYCGMLSYITPPVALCAFPAATIAGSSPMLVAITASRLGVALYLLPFFFVLDPALILQGDIWSTGRALLTAMLSMFLIGSALEGYMMGIGRLWPSNAARSLNFGYLLRIAVVISGVLLGLPWWQTDVLGLALASVFLVPQLIGARRGHEAVSAGSVAIGDTK